MTLISVKAVAAISNVARNIGKTLDLIGASIEVAKYTERLVPSSRIVSVNSIAPTISQTASFVAPSANVVGNVTIGSNSSVWYGATLRADDNRIIIGDYTNIGERVIVHIAKIQGDIPTIIGDGVTVKPGAIIHAATLKDHVVIGSGAQVLDGAVIGSNSIVENGAIVPPGTRVPDGEIWGGSPAKCVRKVTADDIKNISDSAQDVADLATLHAEECRKGLKELTKDEELYDDRLERAEDYWQRDNKYREDDVQGLGAPGRIFDNALTKAAQGLRMKK